MIRKDISMFFSYNDDSLMMELLSGKYTGFPNSHSIFIKSPISHLIAFFYSICNVIPWYPIILISLIIIPVVLLILTEKDKKKKRIMLILLPLLVVSPIIQLTFTTVAAVMVATSMLYFFRASKKNTFFAAILFALSYSVRNEIFLVALAFYLVAILWKLINKEYKNVILFFVTTLVFATASLCINNFEYSSSEWSEYKEINDKRVTLYDYTWYIPYENAASLYESHGISYEEYLLIDNYALTFENQDWTHTLSEASAITSEYYKPYPPITKLYHSVISYLKTSFTEYAFLSIFVLALYCILFFNLLSTRKFLNSLLALCLFLGRNLIWIYLVWKGRLPERITISLFLIEIILLISMIYEYNASKYKKLFTYAGVILYTLASIVLVISCITTYTTHCKGQKKFDSLKAYMVSHPNKTFLLDVRSVNNFNEPMWDTSASQHNYFQTGGWFSASPIIKERINSLTTDSSIEFPDSVDVLVNNPSVTFVLSKDRDNGWLETYVSSRYPNAECYVEDIIVSDNVEFIVYNYQMSK